MYFMIKTLYLLTLTTILTSCHVGRFFIYNFADTNDHKKFLVAELKATENAFHFYETENNNNFNIPEKLTYKDKNYSFEEFLEKNKTLGLLVIRNDSILYENYFKHLDQEKIHPSFSVAKSYVSALMGIAIDEGFIKNVNESITTYMPELSDDFKPITIEHVLNMRSGIHFDESYINPFGDVAKYYYGRNLNKYLGKMKIEGPPDEKFHYSSGNTQVLGRIIENAVGKPLQEYFYEKIWQPLNMEYDASWSVDSKKHNTPKAFCCLNATARDFAKFGKLYLNNGNFNGKELIPENWIEQSLDSAQARKNNFMYSYQWWRIRNFKELKNQKEEGLLIYPDQNGKKYVCSLDQAYLAKGLLGQFIYINPEKNIVIVRLGSDYGKVQWDSFFQEISRLN